MDNSPVEITPSHIRPFSHHLNCRSMYITSLSWRSRSLVIHFSNKAIFSKRLSSLHPKSNSAALAFMLVSLNSAVILRPLSVSSSRIST